MQQWDFRFSLVGGMSQPVSTVFYKVAILYERDLYENVHLKKKK